MAKDKVIELGKTKYNGDYLRSVSEETAVKVLHHISKFSKTQVINAWKQANGKTVRNHKKKKDGEKK